MALSDLSYALENIKTRRAAVYVFNTGGAGVTVSEKLNVGEVRDAMLNLEAIKTPKSTRGAETQVGVVMTITFVIMQTSDDETSALKSIIRENPFGTSFKFTEAVKDDEDEPGYVFLDATASIDAEYNFSGGESSITVTIKGEFANDVLDDLGTPVVAADVPKGVVIGDRVVQF